MDAHRVPPEQGDVVRVVEFKLTFPFSNVVRFAGLRVEHVQSLLIDRRDRHPIALLLAMTKRRRLSDVA